MFGRKRKEPPPDPEELYQRAKAAGQTRGPQDEKEALLRQAAELGHKVAMFDLGVLMERQHRVADAQGWFERARDAGHILAQKKLDALPVDDPTQDPELLRLKQEAEYGEPAAMTAYGRRLWGLGQRTPAAEWLQRAADAGDREAVRQLAFVLQHEPGEQERLLRLDAQHGDLEGLKPLADYLRSWHRSEAIEVYERLEELGEPWSALAQGELHQRFDDITRAEHCYRRAMRSPESAGLARDRLGQMLVELGRFKEAEPLLRDGTGNTEFHRAWIHETRGELAAAEDLYRGLAESDFKQVEAAAGLARVLEALGRSEEARPWRDQAESAGVDLAGPGWPV